MAKFPQLRITYAAVIIGALAAFVYGNIDQSIITDAYITTGSAIVEPGSYLQLTPIDAGGAGARVLYNTTLPVLEGWQANYRISVNSTMPNYGDGIIFILTGMDPAAFMAVPAETGAYMMLTGLTNFAAIIMDLSNNILFFCQTSFDDPLPQRENVPFTNWNSSYCFRKDAFAITTGFHDVVINSTPTPGGVNYSVSVDNDRDTTAQFLITPRYTPVTTDEYYFGFTASTGSLVAQLRVYSWNVVPVTFCSTDNGGCSLNATCIPVGYDNATCECFTGFEGDGYNCTDVIVPVSPPLNAPITNNGPVGTPTAQQPTSNVTAIPSTEPPLEVIVPAIVVPVCAALGVAIFLIVFFVKKRKDKQNKGGSRGEGDDSVPMAQLTPTYTDVPAQESGRVYENMPQNDGKAMQTIDPTGIKPAEIEARMHIPYKSLVFLKEIGSGSYGKVFLGEWQGAQAAIKVNNTVTDVEGFLAEAKLTLGITPHPNLVRTYGVSLDGAYPCIVLEFCGGGSLDKLVFNNSSSVTDEKRKELALKIAYGLIHLHNSNIVHRDLAVRNILLSEDGQPKVSDFGMSRIIQDEVAKGKTKTNVGPLRWMAPENLRDKTYSAKSDVWSYGILVWELVAGKEPHEDEDQLYVAVKIRDEAYHPAIPENCDPILRRVMKRCWKMNPDERPTMEEIATYIRSH